MKMCATQNDEYKYIYIYIYSYMSLLVQWGNQTSIRQPEGLQHVGAAKTNRTIRVVVLERRLTRGAL